VDLSVERPVKAGLHFHRCPSCTEDELCDDASCGAYEDDELVTRGGPAHCSSEWCQSVKRREEAIARLGGESFDGYAVDDL
jgi:hypothetical protein